MTTTITITSDPYTDQNHESLAAETVRRRENGHNKLWLNHFSPILFFIHRFYFKQLIMYGDSQRP